MPRTLWKGAISFGLVHIPVGLYSAEKRNSFDLTMLDRRTMKPVGFKRYNKETGEDVSWDDIVKGYEIAPDKYVMVMGEELDALAPVVSNGIEIAEFIDLAEIDPVFFEHSYYLVPDKGAAKSYSLLLKAMRDSKKVALATVVLRQKQYLTALRPAGDALAMATLYYPDEVVEQTELELLAQHAQH